MDPFLLQFGQKQHPVVRTVTHLICRAVKFGVPGLSKWQFHNSELNTVRFVNFVSRRTGKIARTESSLQRVQRQL